MTHGKERRWGCVGVLALYALAIGATAWMLVALCGCKATEYVPVESAVLRTDTVYSAKFRVDSVIMRDSVTVFQKGDTLIVSKVRDRWRDHVVRDTVYRSANDTVRVRETYPVERELTRWQRARLDLGTVALGGIAVALCVAVAWVVRRFRR